MARQHGFDTWDAFKHHLESPDERSEEPFMRREGDPGG